MKCFYTIFLFNEVSYNGFNKLEIWKINRN